MSAISVGRLTGMPILALIVLLGCQATPGGQHGSAAPPMVSDVPVATSATDAASASDAECPEAPVHLTDLVSMGPVARLRCFGANSISVIAYVPLQEHVCGDTGIHPSWLGGCSEILDLSTEASDFTARLAARVHPSTGLHAFAVPQRRWVRVTGHHDDPAALTCRQTSAPGVVTEPVEATILECRRQFVITELHEVPAP